MEEALSNLSRTIYTVMGLFVLSSIFSYIVVGMMCKRAGMKRDTIKFVTSLVMLVCIFASVMVARNVT